MKASQSSVSHPIASGQLPNGVPRGNATRAPRGRSHRRQKTGGAHRAAEDRRGAMPNLARCTAASGAPLRDLLIGFGLVVLASAGICLSLNLQKLVHMRNADPRNNNEPRVHFTRLPLWWVAVVGNGIFELVNLAALGFAPATLVGPLGCLTVVFNSLTAVFWLREPFLRADLFGIFFIAAGTLCVVGSQAGSPQAPITYTYLRDEVLFSRLFWAYIGMLALGMLLMVRHDCR